MRESGLDFFFYGNKESVAVFSRSGKRTVRRKKRVDGVVHVAEVVFTWFGPVK